MLSDDGGGVDLYKLTTFAIAGVKAQQRQIEQITMRVNKLEEEFEALKEEFAISEGDEGVATTTAIALEEGEGLLVGLLKKLGTLISETAARFVHLASETLTVGSAEQPNGITLFDEETGDPYCLRISGGEMVHTPGECSAQATAALAALGEGSATSTAPTIEVVGNNPARVALGGSYSDLGATITGPSEEAKNLGLHTFIATSTDSEPVEVDSISIDTSTTSEYIIYYRATDQDGNEGEAIRTVVVYDPALVSNEPEPESPPESGAPAEPAPTQSEETVAQEGQGQESTEEPAGDTGTSTPPVAQEDQSTTQSAEGGEEEGVAQEEAGVSQEAPQEQESVSGSTADAQQETQSTQNSTPTTQEGNSDETAVGESPEGDTTQSTL